MSVNTTAINRTRQNFEGKQSVWLFGYGSLIYKVDFPYIECQPACIHGWERRFWQGSHDHRGTPENPGRVATLIPRKHAICTGMAYRVKPSVFNHLDIREKNGYLRFTTPLDFLQEAEAKTEVEALVYIATRDNAAWLGPSSLPDMARQIAASKGPSGQNRDYLFKLADALRHLHATDEHIFELEDAVKTIV